MALDPSLFLVVLLDGTPELHGATRFLTSSFPLLFVSFSFRVRSRHSLVFRAGIGVCVEVAAHALVAMVSLNGRLLIPSFGLVFE